MNLQDQTIGKIRQMPESLVQEVSDFIDFLLMKHNNNNWELWLQFSDSVEIVESDFSDYLSNLEDYEERLARGEIQWYISHEEMCFCVISFHINNDTKTLVGTQHAVSLREFCMYQSFRELTYRN